MTIGKYTETRIDGRIAELELIRPEKRNAMSDGLMAEIEAFYASLPASVRVVILHGRGGHYCSGLDLAEHVSRTAEEGVHHSRNWQRVMDLIQYGGTVTGSAITGAVRADYFWGWGETAEQQAGRMKQKLQMWVLWPRP